MSAEEAMQAVTRVIQRDNEMQLQLLRPSRLVIPEILHALGIISDMEAAEFVLEDRTGVQHEVALSPVPGGSEVEWVDAREPSGDAPLYLRDIETNYWFEFIEAERTVYCQYNEVYDEGDEDIAAFAVRLTDFVQSRGAERLVIDLRHNVGGDNSLNRSFLHALIRCPEVQEPGSLFVMRTLAEAWISATAVTATDRLLRPTTWTSSGPTSLSPVRHPNSSNAPMLTGIRCFMADTSWGLRQPGLGLTSIAKRSARRKGPAANGWSSAG